MSRDKTNLTLEKLFFVSQKGELISYQNLIRHFSESKKNHYEFLCSNNSYFIFLNLIIGLLGNKNTVLLDSSFSKREINALIGSYELTKKTSEVNINIDSLDSLINQIQNSSGRISIFTSGTSGGLPRLVHHTVSTFLRFSRIGKKYSNDIWGLAYNPTHIAGLQVFFQAFFNINTLIEIFGLSNIQLIDKLSVYKVTHISATPSFFRLLKVDNKNPIYNIKRITLGGEKSDLQLYDKINQIFPNAKINNIYASTEFGTLFISNDDIFNVKNEYAKKVKIIDNQLYVHSTLLGEINGVNLDDWYCTKDIVKVQTINPLTFKFIGRKSSIVNIGGYNVLPSEVEDIIREISEVKMVRVFAKKNRLINNILMAEVLLEEGSNLSEKGIINFLKDKVQNHKIPRVIKFVDKILLTRTGKIKQ